MLNCLYDYKWDNIYLEDLYFKKGLAGFVK